MLGDALTVALAGAAPWQFVQACARLGKPFTGFAVTPAMIAAAPSTTATRIVTSRSLNIR